MRVQLGGKEKRIVKHEVKEVSIPQNVMTGSSSEVSLKLYQPCNATFIIHSRLYSHYETVNCRCYLILLPRHLQNL